MRDVCNICGHPAHEGYLCDAPITEDIRVGRGTWDPVGYVYSTDIVDTCRCFIQRGV